MDDTTPATKADIGLIMNEIGKLYMATERWKNEIIEEVEVKMQHHKAEILNHFNLVTENLKHDFWGIHNDKISVLDDRSHNHEERLVTIEKHLAI